MLNAGARRHLLDACDGGRVHSGPMQSGHRPTAEELRALPQGAAAESAVRVRSEAEEPVWEWFDSSKAAKLSAEERQAYEVAHRIQCHLCVQAPTKHSSGHPGGALGSFTFAYFLSLVRKPDVDQPLRISAGHLSLLSYGLQWMFGRTRGDKRLASPQAIIDTFRTASGLPGHVEAGIGDIPFGTGPLGKGVSNALGAAFGLKYQKKAGMVDCLLADGDCQEGQVAEAFRLASHLQLGNLVVHGDFNDIQLSGLPSKTVSSDFASIAYACGWNVIEVQNGNDPALVKAALERASAINNNLPTFICYYTTMGHGVKLMEDGSNTGAENFHGTPLSKEQAEKALKDLPPLEDVVKQFEPTRAANEKRYKSCSPVETDIALKFAPSGYTRAITEKKGAARKDFGAVHLKALMEKDQRIVVLHADLAGSGGFDIVEKAFPTRVINVGVAEANMYMMAAGMRQVGLLPVTYTFAAFGTNEARANARLIDVNCGHTRCAILNDCTHAGLSVGEDGETHQERHYLNVPFDNTQVWMTADCNQAGAMAEKALELVAEGHTSVYTFFPRSSHQQLLSPDGTPIYGSEYVFDGKADLIRGNGDSSDQLTIVATGITVHHALAAADALSKLPEPITARVLNVACVRPLDAAAILQAALETRHLLVVEDHSSEGGLATHVADVIADFELPCSLRRLGVNHYHPSATAEDLFVIAGIDTESIADAAQDEVRVEVRGGLDALISCLYALPDRLSHSRFGASAQQFVDLLVRDSAYLKSLRATWEKSATEKLPTDAELLRRFGEDR